MASWTPFIMIVEVETKVEMQRKFLSSFQTPNHMTSFVSSRRLALLTTNHHDKGDVDDWTMIKLRYVICFLVVTMRILRAS